MAPSFIVVDGLVRFDCAGQPPFLNRCAGIAQPAATFVRGGVVLRRRAEAACASSRRIRASNADKNVIVSPATRGSSAEVIRLSSDRLVRVGLRGPQAINDVEAIRAIRAHQMLGAGCETETLVLLVAMSGAERLIAKPYLISGGCCAL